MWLPGYWPWPDMTLVMYRSWSAVVAVAVLGLGGLVRPAAAVVGGAPAAAPEPDAAVVFIQKYGFSARLEGLLNTRLGYYSFYGIRYAEPPVGPRRFQRPVRRYLAGELTTKQFCQPCAQPDPRNPNNVIGAEDCLCINIYAPKMPGEEQGCPVVLFIHGGNYQSGSSAVYGVRSYSGLTVLQGKHFTKEDTILVTAQYRLGSLGYFSTAEKDASGNVGLFDLHSALTWINDYIEFFGGDPTRVVVMGQGSGASAASLLALSSEGRSASGVAALSGTPLSPGAVRPDAEPARYAKELANRTNCPEKPAERLLNCLRKLPFQAIIKADKDMNMNMIDTQKFLNDISGRSGSGARVEGEDDVRALPPLVDEQPSDSLKKKRQRVPLLTGVTSAETARAVFGKYSSFLKNQLQMVEDFIKNDIVGGLRSVVDDVKGLVAIPTAELTSALPLADYYQSIFDNSLNPADGLNQIVEATGDALFNFPAYQTVKSWSDGSSAFLYSFEHVGNLSKGSYFLPGVPLADESNDTLEGRSDAANGPSHGDELAYLFEPLNEQGEPLGEDVSSSDARVRDNFVGLISKFAHTVNEDQTNNTRLFPSLLPFSSSSEQFLKIGEEITVDKDFKFCQMGLWGNMANRIAGMLCQNLIGNLLKLPKQPLPPVPVPTDLPLPVKPPSGGNLLPDLTGGKRKTPKKATGGTTKKPLDSLFGGWRR